MGTKCQGPSRNAQHDGFGLRQPVARSGDAAHRPAERPRRSPFPAAESLVAPARPFPTKDAFAIGGNTRSTIGAFFVASFRGTRSHDRGTPDEWIQSPALFRLSAKAHAVLTELRRCPCLAPVLGNHGRRSHRGRAAGSGEVRQRERPPGVAGLPIPRLGGRSH